MSISPLDDPLERKVLTTIKKYRMLSQGDKVLLSVSGGVDSSALWLLFLRLKDLFALSLHVFHLNHMVRPEAAEDANFVAKLAEGAGIPSSILSYDVPSFASLHRLSSQEAARKVRYELMEEVAKKMGADRIAVGHQADDQAETILMWLLRGAGMEGLGGIPPVRGPYIRPLIEVRRGELEGYCRKNRLEPRLDASNLSPAYERNRIRLELIPFLTERYQPRLVEILAYTGKMLADENAVVSQLTQEKLAKLVRFENNEARIYLPALQSLPPALRRRIMRRTVEQVKGDLREIESKHVENLVDSLSGGERIDVDWPGGIAVFQEYDYLVFSVQRRRHGSRIEKVELKVPGITEIPPLALEIEARVLDAESLNVVQDGRKAFLDYEKLTLPLVAGPRGKGDAFVPLGMRNFKKLQDFLVDEKVPRRERDSIPIVESGKGIVWVAGYRIDERFKVTAGTRKVLALELKRAMDTNS